jgi:hypothetical protein
MTKSGTKRTVILDTIGCSEAILLFVVGLETFGTSVPFVKLKRKVTSGGADDKRDKIVKQSFA